MTELLTPTDIYRQLQAELLEQGRYPHPGDAHYLFKHVPVLDAAGVQHPGKLRLEDYQSWTSLEYDHYPPAAHQEAQERLLRAGRAILGLQFYRDDKLPTSVSYTLCYPDTVSPDTAAGILFYEVEGIAPFIGMPSDPSAPTIVRADSIQNVEYRPEDTSYSFVEQPQADTQLMFAYTAIINR